MHLSSLLPPLLAAADIVRKSPQVTFVWGAVLIFLLFYYLGTAEHRRKKIVGTVLSLMMSLFCIWAIDGWNVFLGKPLNIKLGMDLAGGSEFTVQLKPGVDEKGQPKQVTPDSVQQAIGILEKRLNPDGAKDLLMAPQGEDRILIQMPGVKPDEVQEVRTKLEQTAHLEFRLVHPQSRTKLLESKVSGTPVFGWVEMPGKEHKDDPSYPESYLVSSRPDIEGKHVTEAFVSYGLEGWTINLSLDSQGADLFGKLTTAHAETTAPPGDLLAIIVDGEVLSAPHLKVPILDGKCVITGKFTEKDARSLATALDNPLENPMEIMSESSVSPQFGQQTIQQAIYTGIAGLLMIGLFSMVYYRLAGLIALVGLCVNLLMVFGAMSLFDFTLTMPGIAGIVLSVGMAVDANVLIYERLREEMRAGKSLVTALEAAFEKAFSAIFDANITTLISAVILFYLGSGLVKGFAITLTVGIVGSLLGALIVTRVVFHWFTDAKILQRINVTEIIPHGIFNILGHSKPVIIGALALAALSIAIFPIKGSDAIGIDFRGGSLIRFGVAPTATVDAHEVEKALKDGGINDAYVQESSTGTGTLISVRVDEADGPKVEDQMRKQFAGKLEGGQTESVGSIAGREMAIKSCVAFAVAVLFIIVYVVVFYEFSFALAAFIALLHDCLITIGLSVLFGQQLSIIHIGALLTVAGYSINDKIVVFDRIREIIRSRNGDLRDIMNEAISLTLSRTLLTGVTTLGPMAALLFFGGPAMKDFSLPIIIGVLVGTYSSIYIASPIVLWWARWTGKSLRRQVLDSESRDVKPPVAA